MGDLEHSVDGWVFTQDDLPWEQDVVTVRVNGRNRSGYYRIDDRWYALVDLDRWQMNTSPYWEEDRAWYLTTEEVDAWKPEETQAPWPQSGDSDT